MAVTRLSTKGQVVIPQAVREALGWKSGDAFEVVARDGTVLLVPVATRPAATTLDDVVGCLHVHGIVRTVEEMDAAVTSATRRRWRR